VDELHETEGSVAPPVGYGTCRIAACGVWELTIVLARSGGVCTGCHLAGLGEQFRHIEIVSRGRRTAIRKTTNRPGPPRRTATRGAANHAKRRALKRLKNLFPDLYDILVAEERANVGLEPWPLRRALEHHDDPDGARMLHELDEVGVR
jgi:hypothetical protein